MEYYGNNDWRDYHLSHHGILGMRWGRRNGPPYPLDPADHSASERKAGWKKSLDGKNPEEYGKKLSKEDKYKQSELKKTAKYYDKAIKQQSEIQESNRKWTERKRTAYENATDPRKKEKLAKKVQKGEEWDKASELKKNAIAAQKSKELDYIKNMTLDDISKEKKAAGKAAVDAVGLSLVGVTLGMMTGVYVYATPNIRAVKSNLRQKEIKKREDDARYKRESDAYDKKRREDEKLVRLNEKVSSGKELTDKELDWMMRNAVFDPDKRKKG